MYFTTYNIHISKNRGLHLNKIEPLRKHVKRVKHLNWFKL